MPASVFSSIRPPPWKLALLIGLAGVAVAVWVVHMTGKSGGDTRALEDVTGIEVQVVSVQHRSDAYRIRCRATNHRDRDAEHLVFTAQIIDDRGAVVASNPLAAIADLPAGGSRDFDIIVPAGRTMGRTTARVECTLVRWRRAAAGGR